MMEFWGPMAALFLTVEGFPWYALVAFGPRLLSSCFDLAAFTFYLLTERYFDQTYPRHQGEHSPSSAFLTEINTSVSENFRCWTLVSVGYCLSMYQTGTIPCLYIWG